MIKRRHLMLLRFLRCLHGEGVGKTLSAVRVAAWAGGGRFERGTRVNSEAVGNIGKSDQFACFGGMYNVPISTPPRPPLVKGGRKENAPEFGGVPSFTAANFHFLTSGGLFPAPAGLVV